MSIEITYGIKSSNKKNNKPCKKCKCFEVCKEYKGMDPEHDFCHWHENFFDKPEKLNSHLYDFLKLNRKEKK